MRKYLPIIVGLFLGWIIFHPPSWIHDLGGASYLIMGMVAFAGVIAFTVFSLNSNLPADLPLSPETTTSVSAELDRYGQQYTSLGFSPVSSTPFRVGVSPPATLIAFINEKERTYGTVFKTGTFPSKTSFDFFSYFQGDTGGLTTSPAAQGGVLPLPPGSFKQVFPGMAIIPLFEKHKQAISYLKTRGIECKELKAVNFQRDYRSSVARMRRSFTSGPIQMAVTAVWRTALKKTPYKGSIQNQPEIQKQLQAVLSRKQAIRSAKPQS